MFGTQNQNGTTAAAAAEAVSSEEQSADAGATAAASMASARPTRAEVNRRNALKSTGPRTAAGKERSRFNAVKHGMRARHDVLPGEDAEAFQDRIDSWTADLAPGGEVERHLIERAARSSWQLERADRAELARLSKIIRGASDDAERQDEEDALALGRRLLWDPRGPFALYPKRSVREGLLPEREPRTSYSGKIDDPDDPARLIVRLEATAAGCRWLIDRWGELENLLETGRGWQAPDRLKAVRLLGRQPLDAADSTTVLEIYLCTWVLSPERLEMDAFADLWKEVLAGEEARFKTRLLDRRTEELLPRDRDTARERLGQIVQSAVNRLKALRNQHLVRTEAERAARADEEAFDASDTGERLRRYQIACNRSMLRTLDVLRKLRNDKSSARNRATAAEAEVGAVTIAKPKSNTSARSKTAALKHAEMHEAASKKPETRRAPQQGRRPANIENRTNEAKAAARARPVSTGPGAGRCNPASHAGTCVQASTCVKLEVEEDTAQGPSPRRALPWS